MSSSAPSPSGIYYADIGSTEMRAIYSKAGLSAIGRDGDVLAEKVDALGKLPLKHDPGERFTYGLSVDVLGRLVEVVSGMPLDQFFRTRIFEPLGMRDSYFAIPKEKQNRLVALHTTVDMMLTRQNGAIKPPFGLGFQLETPDDDHLPPSGVGTFSCGGAFTTTYWADPKVRIVALIYTTHRVRRRHSADCSRCSSIRR